ncbi:hypothetical protein DXG01_002495 [Tephrocybe rancida]|nr:hypothetical protein DXG01_002495 [Tephrocybe rancida]
MAHNPSPRSTASVSQSNLQPLNIGQNTKQQRRMTSPASNASLVAPEVQRPQGRPPSPLRNEFVPDTSTGIHPDDFSDEDEDDDPEDRRKWTERSPSPSSSVSQLAASFTQRVGNFLGNMTPRSPGSMPTDAELEAEAERERDRSRREAERILTREAEERKMVEERVLAMMSTTRSLPPPPSHSQGSNPSSPSGSQKESSGNWWTAAKNRLTPTKEKEPPTPAQQVIMEAKAREKDKKGKGKEKEKEREIDNFSTNDSMLNLNIPHPPPHRKPVPPSPSSPTPSRPSLSNMAPNLTPSPMRSLDAVSSSPSREAPLLYAQFNPQGTLDVAGTLLTIAKRFEKLEKWTVGHVRALEDRMSDVERWLVDKEKEKEKADADKVSNHSDAPVSTEIMHEIRDMKDGLTELQGRVGSLGREMAKLATAPSNLSSGPSRQPPPVSTAPQTTSTYIVHDRPASPPSPSPLPATSPITLTPQHTRLTSGTARESTSPPMASSKASGTRLPYPTGDYATPPNSTAPLQGAFASPPHSPPSSLAASTRIRPLSVPGLGLGLGILKTSSNSSLASSARAASPQQRAVSPPAQATNQRALPQPQAQTHAQAQAQAKAEAHGLPIPKRPSPRPASVSPTPRKRYTVALGEPIVSPPDVHRGPSPRPTFSSSPTSSAPGENRDEDEFQDETIGKSSSARFAPATNGDYKSTPASALATTSPSPSSKRRIRAQSAYGFEAVQQLQAPIAPLRPKMRSRSTERLAGGGGQGPEHSFPTGKFVDPLVLRRQEKEKEGVKKPVGKVPIGQLVAFFDGEKREK